MSLRLDGSLWTLNTTIPREPRKLDELYTQYPFYGVRKMTAALHQQGDFVNVKRVRRLLCKMGLEAIYPKPNLSKTGGKASQHYPY